VSRDVRQLKVFQEFSPTENNGLLKKKTYSEWFVMRHGEELNKIWSYQQLVDKVTWSP